MATASASTRGVLGNASRGRTITSTVGFISSRSLGAAVAAATAAASGGTDERAALPAACGVVRRRLVGRDCGYTIASFSNRVHRQTVRRFCRVLDRPRGGATSSRSTGRVMNSFWLAEFSLCRSISGAESHPEDFGPPRHGAAGCENTDARDSMT